MGLNDKVFRQQKAMLAYGDPRAIGRIAKRTLEGSSIPKLELTY